MAAIAGVVIVANKEAREERDRARFASAVQAAIFQRNEAFHSYLLSGDPRRVDQYEKAGRALEGLLEKELESPALDPQRREAVARLLQTEKAWRTDIGAPLIAGRKEVDAGQSTVAQLQITFLQNYDNAAEEGALNGFLQDFARP